jgi:hypothetical protein
MQKSVSPLYLSDYNLWSWKKTGPEDIQDANAGGMIAKYRFSQNANSILIDDTDNSLALLIPILKQLIIF